jgi:hypothetical protein
MSSMHVRQEKDIESNKVCIPHGHSLALLIVGESPNNIDAVFVGA